ncbi:hypothetical protein F-VV10_0266 [Faustovirus]|nr:hypothetical protein F-VV10_0266 [Faustovirus]
MASGRQDVMLMAPNLYGSGRRRDLYNGKHGAYICNHCGCKTDNFDELTATAICVQCRMVIIRMIIRAIGAFKRAFPHSKINIINKHGISDTLIIAADDPEEATTVAHELVKFMGFNHLNDEVVRSRYRVWLIGIDAPVRYRRRFYTSPNYSHIVKIHFDIKTTISAIETTPTSGVKSLYAITMSAIKAQLGAVCGTIMVLPNELIEPLFHDSPEIAIRFLMG